MIKKNKKLNNFIAIITKKKRESIRWKMIL